MFRLHAFLIKTTALLLCAAASHAATLSDIKFAELPGERAELRLVFDEPPVAPTGYSIEQPARIVLDFSGIKNALTEKKYTMSVGDVSSAVIVEGGGRTRLIVNLETSVPYRAYMDGNIYVVEVGVEPEMASAGFMPSVPADDTSATQESESAMEQAGTVSPTVSNAAPTRESPSAKASNVINDIDFRRGEVGEGKIIIKLGSPNVKIDVEEVSSGVAIKFLDSKLPEELRRKLDVVDFATPVTMISAKQEANGALIGIATTGEYDYLAYQADNEYVVSIKPLTRQELEERKKEFAYVGDRLSLNFQNIPVRNVLQLIADFTQLNLVASDTVTGSITLRLDNVPWDQALDIVLKTKGLDKRQMGNVLMVAPAAEIAERERQEIQTQKQLQELAPLRTEYIRIRYANARELFSLFMEGGSGGAGGAGGGDAGTGGQRNSTGTILSERGQAIVDERTNSIILTDTEEKIEEFKRLVDRIDIPIRQVMIEARIVIANSDFRKELGTRIIGAGVETSPGGSKLFQASGRLEGIANEDGVPANFFQDLDGDGELASMNVLDSSLVNLGVPNPAGAFSWSILGSNFLLGLELSALQNSGYAEIVSQPKVITGDKQEAVIQSGTEIGYQEESASGGTTTSFKEAVLKLQVTPQITPDNRVIMDLEITQDSISGFENSIPILDITQLETQVLVSDGETVVLGGIYQTENTTATQKVPLLGDIPYLGRIFRKDIKREDKRELLLFITPRIMASNLNE